MDIPLKCECGKVQGVATDISAGTGIRIICYCDDCQAFANHLGCGSTVLDEYGGTDIFQLAPAQVKITRGKEYIRCLHLRPKGIFRWYASCCNTTIGNTLSAKVPFIGLIHSFMDDRESRDSDLGPVRGYVFTKFARGSLPAERKQGFPFRLMAGSIYKLLTWKLKGLGQPSPFFDSDGIPISDPQVLN